ncbi:MAG: hypothetical protein AABZ55_10370 [Bdellovibrionota bacterium]
MYRAIKTLFRSLVLLLAVIYLTAQLAFALGVGECLVAAMSRYGKGDVYNQNTVYDQTYDEQKAWEKVAPLLKGQARNFKINQLRELVKKHGIYTVIPEKKPKTQKEVEDLEFLYGTKILFAPDHKKGTPPIRVKGVVLHPGTAPDLASAYLGTANPHLGHLRYYNRADKYQEYQLVSSVSKNYMPETVRSTELMEAHSDSDLKNIRSLLNQYSRDPKDFNYSEFEQTLAKKMTQYLQLAKEHFPDGAFFKLTHENQTGDCAQMLTSWDFKPAKMAKEFVDHLKQATNNGRSPMPPQKLAFELTAADSRPTQFVYAWIHHPAQVLAQAKLPIAKTALGFPMEFRVDFVAGVPTLSMARHSNEYYPEEAKAAEKYFKNFLEDMNAHGHSNMTGGADVIRLKNGEWKIIELNMGTESGFAEAHFSPVNANSIVAQLSGRPTTMQIKLEEIFAQPLKVQRQYLEELNRTAKQNYLEEVAVWLRDRHLQEWDQGGRKKSGTALIEQLSTLLEGLGQGKKGRKTFAEIEISARNYIEGRN